MSDLMKTTLSSVLSFSLRAACVAWLLGLSQPTEAQAAAPAWWQQRGVLDANQSANDYAAVNIGQLKHIAKQAMLELEAKLPGGAGTAIQQMVTSWSTVTPDRNDFAAVNVGQLKAVAKPFYDRLNEAGYILPAPWSNDIQEKNDFAVTNVGQLKMVFSFCIDCTPTQDTDSDGLPDWWEMQHFPLNSPSFNKSGPDDDPDNDLLTNAEEYKNGTNPKSGADGLKIQLEVYDRSGFAYSEGFVNWAGGDTLFRSRKTTHNFSAYYEGGTQYNESYSWSIDETYTHPIVTGALVEMLDQPAYWLMNMITDTTTGDTTRTPSFPFAYLFQKTLETCDEQPTYKIATTFYEPQSPTAMGSAQSVYKYEFISPINDAEMFTALNGDLSPTSPSLQIISTNTYGSFAQRQISGIYAINANVCSYRYALRSKNGANLQLDSPKSITWIESHEATLNDVYGGRHYSQPKRAILNIGEETPLYQLDARQFLPSGQPGTQTAYHSVNLLPIDIEPDTGMAGVVGDVVKSLKAGSTVEHFVTPQKTPELNQEYIILKAVGVTADQITPGNANQIVEWDPSVGEAVPGEPLKWRVKRDAATKHAVKIKAKQGGTVAAQMNVWVVWAPVTVANNQGFGVVVDTPSPAGRGSRSGTDWDFEALVQPSSIIIKSDDIPDLTGGPVNPERPPESTIGNHALDAQGFADPKSKWDLSRCWRAKTIAPTVTAADCDIPAGSIIGGDYPTPAGGTIHATTPNAAADHFPSNKLEGNDYRSRSQDPYSGGQTPGKLVDDDTPRHFVKSAAGTVGDTVEVRYQFGAFSRLQIGTKWYRISDRKPWRFLAKYRKASEQADGMDYNGDGDQQDEVWIDAGTTSDATNGGF